MAMKTIELKSLCVATVFATALLPSAIQAHTSIWPRDSMQGATEKYSIRVPTEGRVTTIGADVGVPEGVVVETIGVPVGWTYELKKRADGRITNISFRMNIKPGEFAEFSFVARNPRDRNQLVWSLRQLFVDGTSQDFTNGPNGIRPTAIVKLATRSD